MKYFIDLEWGLVIICALYICMHSDLSVYMYTYTRITVFISLIYLLTSLSLPPTLLLTLPSLLLPLSSFLTSPQPQLFPQTHTNG